MKNKINDIIRDNLGADAIIGLGDTEKNTNIFSRYKIQDKDNDDKEELDKLYAKQVLSKILVKKLQRIDNNIQEIMHLLVSNVSYIIFGEMPVSKIKAYFGEKVAMYYDFLALYTKYLFVLAFFGIVVFVIQMTESEESKNIEFYIELGFSKNYLITAFSVCYTFLIIIWSTLFIEMWRKRELMLATMWGKYILLNMKGQLHFHEMEETMPRYKGEKRRSPVNDNLNDLYSSSLNRNSKKIIGYLIILGIVTLLIVADIYLIKWKGEMISDNFTWNDNVILSQIPSFIIVIQILLLNYIFNYFAKYLNLFENPKHFTQYEDSLALKQL